MKKIMVTLMIVSLLSAAAVTPALAHDWDYPHVPGGIFNPLWPVAAALAIPAAVVGAVVSTAVPEPVVVAPPAPVYSPPPAYYAPRAYVAPRPYYYAPRPYYRPYGYGYYRPYYRSYRYGW